MTDEILINVTPQETRVAVIGSGQVHELVVERTASRGLVGNICMGRVARVLPGIQAAFVEIGLERAAFLHVADIWEHRRQTGEATYPIERILAEGQPLLVQVVKEPLGTKGARLSTQVSIAGRMLVYLPHDPHIGISQRIEDEAGRQLLRERLRELLPPDEKGGFILRTLAETATEEELRADIEYLRHLWRDIGERALHTQAPALVYQDLSLAQRVLRDMVSADTSRVLVDSRENFQKLATFAETYTPNVRAKLEHYTGERPLFDLYNVEPEIEKALSRRVDLKSGGYLIVDQTEAMTTIDVNTGGFLGSRNLEETVFRTNLEATESLERQLCEPCPACGGRGSLKTAETVTYEIFREITRAVRQFEAQKLLVLAAPKVVNRILEEESGAVAELEEFIGKTIRFQPEEHYSQEQYDVVLL